MDIVDRQTRSRMMSRIRGNNTKPETRLRKALHARGFRFRLNVRTLPGTPDIVLPKWNAVIFVHGCFWHRHPGCLKSTTPTTNVDFWKRKFAANVARDARALSELHERNWRTVVVWECAITPIVHEDVLQKISAFLMENSSLRSVHREFGG